MAKNPHPEFIQEIMEEDFGTRVLITDPKSDIYFEQHRKRQLKQKFPQWFEGNQETE